MDKFSKLKPFEKDDISGYRELIKKRKEEGKPKTFSDKYKPRTLNDIMRNRRNIELLKNWLSSKDKSEPYVLLAGEVGVGKTEFLKILLEDLNYSIIEYTDEISKTMFESLLEKLVFSNIENLFFGETKKNIIIIDNYQNILSSSQKQSIIKFLKTKKTNPVIFVSSTLNNITDLIRGKGLILEFEKPTVDDIFNLGKKICDSENIVTTDKQILDIIKNTKSDVRGFIRTLEFCFIDNSKGETNVSNLINKYKYDLNLDMNNTFLYFLNNKDNSFNDRIRMSTIHTSIILQENYLSVVNKDSPIEDIYSISELVSYGDFLSKKQFENKDFENYDIINSITTVGVVEHIRNNLKKKFKLVFPNRKNVTIISRNCCYFPLVDIYYIIKSIFMLCKDNNLKLLDINDSALLLYRFMIYYNIDLDKLIKCIFLSFKLDNISYIRYIITKLKNNIVEILNN